MSLLKVISGGQTGADQAGLFAAKHHEIETGGTAPKGYRTLKGDQNILLRRFNLEESYSPSYPVRTATNVAKADGTLRLAYNFTSAGEMATLKAIKNFKKPYFDVDMNNPIDPTITANWIVGHNISILNIAGNGENANGNVFSTILEYLKLVFSEVNRIEKELF